MCPNVLNLYKNPEYCNRLCNGLPSHNHKMVNKKISKTRCKECGKEIRGYTKKDVLHNLNVHIEYKHPELFDVPNRNWDGDTPKGEFDSKDDKRSSDT